MESTFCKSTQLLRDHLGAEPRSVFVPGLVLRPSILPPSLPSSPRLYRPLRRFVMDQMRQFVMD